MSGLLNLKKGVVETLDILGSVEEVTANGAITIPDYGRKTVFVNKAGVCAMTLAAPSTAQNGVELCFVSMTAQAHTLTVATIGMNDLGTSGDVGTFGGAKGDGITVQAYNGDWWVTRNTNVTLA